MRVCQVRLVLALDRPGKTFADHQMTDQVKVEPQHNMTTTATTATTTINRHYNLSAKITRVACLFVVIAVVHFFTA